MVLSQWLGHRAWDHEFTILSSASSASYIIIIIIDFLMGHILTVGKLFTHTHMYPTNLFGGHGNSWR